MTTHRLQIKQRLIALLKPRQAYTAAGIAKALAVPRPGVSQVLRRLHEAGQIGALTVGPDRLYFATAADAEAFTDAQASQFAEQQLALRQQRNAKAFKRANPARYAVVPAKPGKPAPVTLTPRETPSQAVDYSRAVITRQRIPNDPRYFVDSASVTPGACRMEMPAGRWSDYVLARQG